MEAEVNRSQFPNAQGNPQMPTIHHTAKNVLENSQAKTGLSLLNMRLGLNNLNLIEPKIKLLEKSVPMMEFNSKEDVLVLLKKNSAEL